ncbi:unknown similar to AMEV117 [Adoxophyes honmai entomopoxvirus 'L']|uniref:Uncharacterized protein n=1 Tax=Adoxophyes honmai entomopoxvirus 'L' TaxID=1293540 RepID=A0A916KP09_9POXV|nr:unknown similar to AMEV117 [Adoxophyes honmai entomopoxvirus 'L']CCU55421.1 unknown similar to AMEV117 [Adoxophyes honmai entomopoxvirus 'L']
MRIKDKCKYTFNECLSAYYIKKMKNKYLINEFLYNINKLKKNISSNLLYIDKYIVLLDKSINRIPYNYYTDIKNIINLKLICITYFIKLHNNISSYNKIYLILNINKIIKKLNSYYLY